jgi:hypothetical protein
MCANSKEFKTNSKGSAKQEDKSSPRPPYSPDLTSSDFYLCGPLKDALRGRRFADDDELKHSAPEELQRFSKEFYATDIQRLTQRWKKCVGNGDFVGK